MRYFVIFLIMGIAMSMSYNYAFGWCDQNEDWPDAPCYAPYQSPSESQERKDWEKYYDYKGSEWMEAKKLELIEALQTDTVNEWLRQTPNDANRNVYAYFSAFEDLNKYKISADIERKPLNLDDFASKLWYEHDYIIDGTILDIRGYGQPERVYDIRINSFFKPESANAKVITVYGSPNFYNVNGDRGIFFIKKQDARWIFGEYGAKATPDCPPSVMYHNPTLIDPPFTRGGGHDFSKVDCAPHYYRKYLPEYMNAHGSPVFSPLTQQIDGVSPNEVVCNEGLELILKQNGRAACVKPESLPKLIERGWAKTVITSKQISTFDYEIKTGGITHGSQYQIAGGIADQITYDANSNSLVISLDAQEDGHIQIMLPSGLLSPIGEEAFAKYSVIQDGKEADFEQLAPILLEIPFEKDTKQILIERESPQEKSTQEHYEIDIIGLKDKYVVGEPYSFYFVISGYGYGCASYEASYPDENGNIMTTTVAVQCAAEQSMHEFEINFSELRGTLGNVGIKKPGTYTVTVTFEKPNKFFPTTASKEFWVVEN